MHNTMHYCKRCLLNEMQDQDFAKSIYDYIGSLSDEIKTPDEIYQKRLNLCRECDNLINGMCKLCGCFIEVRAAKKTQYCPLTASKW